MFLAVRGANAGGGRFLRKKKQEYFNEILQGSEMGKSKSVCLEEANW